MRRFPTTVALLSLAALSCGKSATRLRREVKDCSAISLDAAGISACLVAQFKWAEPKAAAAGVARQHELDSIAKFQADSLWQMDAKAHRQQLAGCAAAGGEVARCLENNYGWDGQRAVATVDSLWRQDAATHRSQVQRCQRQKKSSVGSCLILYYKWDSKRAFALDDSIARAKVKAMNSR
jgi:hypothetical protein